MKNKKISSKLVVFLKVLSVVCLFLLVFCTQLDSGIFAYNPDDGTYTVTIRVNPDDNETVSNTIIEGVELGTEISFGTGLDVNKVTVGNTTVTAADFTLEEYQYTFYSWTGDTYVDGDELIIANYTQSPGEFEITFMDDDMDITNQLDNPTYTYGESYTLPTEFDPDFKPGHIFLGWTETNEIEDTDYVTSITSSEFGERTFYAKWEVCTYTVSIDVNQDAYGTVSHESIEDVPYGTEVTYGVGENANQITIGDVTITATPSSSTSTTSFYFDYWDYPDSITDTLAITAYFESTGREYGITYMDGSENITDALEDTYRKYSYGAEKILPSNLEKEGYSLSGWTALDAPYNEDTNPYITSISDTDLGDKTFYAKFAPVLVDYSIEFYYEELDGTFILDTTLYETALTNSVITIDDTDFDYVEYFSRDLDNVNNVTSQTISADGSTTLKIYYSRDEYTVTMNLFGELYETYTNKWGQSYEMPIPSSLELLGGTFEGWYDSETLASSTIEIPTDNITYECKVSFVINYVTNGAESTTFETTNSYVYGEVTYLPISENIAKAGHDFVGWTLTNEESDTDYVTSITASEKAEKTFYAKWEIKTYSVSIDVNDELYGSVSQETIDVPYGTEVTIGEGDAANQITIGDVTITATPNDETEMETFYFDSWNYSSTISGDETFVANFGSTAKEFTITFMDGSTNISSEVNEEYLAYTYGLGTNLPMSTDATKQGYVFAGWVALDAPHDLVSNPYIDSITDSEYGNKTYYASWEPDYVDYTIEVYLENTLGYFSYESSFTESAYTGSVVTIADTEYDSIEYYVRDLENDSNVTSQTISADGSTKFKLYYARKSYNLSLNIFGEQEYSYTLKWQDTMLLPTPTNEELNGGEFIGWFFGNTQIIGELSMSKSDLVLNARVRFDLSLELEGGEFVLDESPTSYIHGQEYFLPSADDVTVPGYILIGWTETNSPSDLTYIANTDADDYGDKVYYAKWEALFANSQDEGIDGSSPEMAFEISNRDELLNFSRAVNTAPSIYGSLYYRLTDDIVFNDEVFAFDESTGLISVSNGSNTIYLGTGIAGTDSLVSTSEMGKWYDGSKALMNPQPEQENGIYNINGMEVYNWESINRFSGYLDGDGYTISGFFSIETASNGIFRSLYGAIVDGLSIGNGVVLSEHYSAGSIANSASNSTIIRNCSNEAMILGPTNTGGLVGNLFASSILNSYNTGLVYAGYNSGGLVGSLNSSKLINSYNAGLVLGRENSGQVFGESSSSKVFAYYDENQDTVPFGESTESDIVLVQYYYQDLSIASPFQMLDENGTVISSPSIGFDLLCEALNKWVNAHSESNNYQSWAVLSDLNNGNPIFGIGYSVLDNTQNITVDNLTAVEGFDYVANIEAPDGYMLPDSITVTIGGVSTSNFIYSKELGRITILAQYVTENIEITGSGISEVYSISFDGIDGAIYTTLPESHTYGTATTVPNPTKTGYEFLGWRINGGSANKNLTLSAYGYYDDISLLATWQIISYTVEYYLDGEKIDSLTQECDYGLEYDYQSLPSVDAGYTIVGWFENTPKGEQTAIQDESFTNLPTSTGDIVTFYAFSNANTNTAYVVKHYFELLNGSYSDTLDNVITQNLTGTTGQNASAQPLVAGALPTGFVLDTENANSVTSGIISGDNGLVLKLYYKRITYTVSVTVNDTSYGSVSVSLIPNVKYGTEIEIGTGSEANKVTVGETTVTATPSLSNDQYTYAFVDWTTDVSDTSMSIRANFSRVTKQYTVTFYDADGTTSLGTSTVDYGATATYQNEAPTKTGTTQYDYVFNGWYTSITDGTSDNLSNVIANRNVYAHFTETTRGYTVTWKNGEEVIEVDSSVQYGSIPVFNGTAPTKASDNENQRYDFIGWKSSLDNEIYTEFPALTGETVYTAEFELKNIVLNTPDQDPADEEAVVIDGNIDVPEGVEEQVVFVVKVVATDNVSEQLKNKSNKDTIVAYNAKLLKNNIEYTDYSGLMTVKIAKPAELIGRSNVEIVIWDKETNTAVTKVASLEGDYLCFETETLGDFVIVADKQESFVWLWVVIIVVTLGLGTFVLIKLFPTKEKHEESIDNQ